MTTLTEPTHARDQTETRSGVLVVGGGYAGLHAARAAAQAGVPVTIVDRHGTHDFVTRLAAVAGGTAPVDDASVDLHRFGHAVRIGDVTRVEDGAVTLSDDSVIAADAVVVTAGSGPARPPIDGIEHAMPLRTASDAFAIRSGLEHAERLVIIGGGPTGVQLAGAVAAEHPDVTVTIIESSDRLLSNLSHETGQGAERILTDRGVVVHTETEVDTITSDGVMVDDEHITGLVVWAGGFEPRTTELGLDVSDDGRILIDDQLRVLGTDRTFAAGDIAAHRNASGESLPMSAQIAVQAGTAAGRNAAAVVTGGDLERPSLVQRGWVLDLGGCRGLAEFGPVKLTMPFADLAPPLLHAAIDLKTLFGIGGLSALTL